MLNRQCKFKRIEKLKSKFNNKIGYSDHTIGNSACKIAVTLGASVIEKHFTFNKINKRRS